MNRNHTSTCIAACRSARVGCFHHQWILCGLKTLSCGSCGSWFVFFWLSLIVAYLPAQVTVSDPYLRISASAADPLFTTYAAPMARSRFFADKAYHLDYYSGGPLAASSQYAGELAVVWKVNNVVVARTADYARPPVVIASFPDLAVLEYELFAGLAVQEVFCVYSSGAAVVDLAIRHAGDRPYDLALYGVLRLPAGAGRVARSGPAAGLVLQHVEPLERPISALYANRGYPTDFRDLLACDPAPDSRGAYPGCGFDDFHAAVKRPTKADEPVAALNGAGEGPADLAALQKNVRLAPGQTARFRFVRAVQDARRPEAELLAEARAALAADLQAAVDADVALFRGIPRPAFAGPADKLVYLGAFNLARQCMLPPTGRTDRNFYVFSREPVWGWGHGHQVMHESLAMIPYARLDAASAVQSQRIFLDQQYPDGLIPYRVGPRGPQVYPHQGAGTTSSPFFAWTSWEVYRIGGDKAFLADAYRGGARFVRYLEAERDLDRDGLFEWGPYGIIENVRDGWNAVFQLFSAGEDEGRDISAELEDLDLSCMVANEMYYLKLMAAELGDTAGEKEWGAKFDRLAGLINRFMWDEGDKFYYHVAKVDHSFTFEGESLKRKEIIGFLPLWARVAPPERAAALRERLKDPKSFWREYGVPTLAADDPSYCPFVDGCCRWNGPVWLLWDWLVLVGLDNYGFRDDARALARKMVRAAATQLSKNHRFWESYGPDFAVQESPANYIWDAILVEALLELNGAGFPIEHRTSNIEHRTSK